MVEKGFRRYTVPRFDKGRFFVTLPDGSEVEESALTVKVQAEMWKAATDAAFVWFATRKPCDSG